MSRSYSTQVRLLSFLALAPAGRFVDLVRIDRARQVRPGDDLFVPSVVARGWAETRPQHRPSVRITEAGRETLISPSADDHVRQRDGAKGFGEILGHPLGRPGHPSTDGGTGMIDEATEQGPRVDACVSEVVAAYVSNNRVPRTDLPALIELVAWSVMALTTSRPLTGIVTIKKPTKGEIEKSVGRDGIISFVDGKTYRTLRRHLGRYGHTPQSYRMRYGLPVDYPMVAPSYSERRTELSKQNSAKQRELAAAGELT